MISFWVPGSWGGKPCREECPFINTSRIGSLPWWKTWPLGSSYRNSTRAIGPSAAGSWKHFPWKKIRTISFLTMRCWSRRYISDAISGRSVESEIYRLDQHLIVKNEIVRIFFQGKCFQDPAAEGPIARVEFR